LVEASVLHAFKFEVVVLVEHQGLVTILKDRQILELNQELWNLRLIDEETGKEHEWDDKNRCKRHCQLFVREDRSKNESITS